MNAARKSNAVEAARAVAWTGGIVMIVVAIALPFAHEYLYAAPFRADMEDMADRLVARQQDELVRRERFAPAAAIEEAARDPRIAAEARLLDDGQLLIRIMTAADAVATSWLPAAIFERTVDPEGEATEGLWRTRG